MSNLDLVRTNFKPFPKLESNRLILRKCELSDAESFYDLARNSELTTNLVWDCHKSLDETKNFIISLGSSEEKLNQTFAICNKESDKFMGLITLRLAKTQSRA